MTIGGQLSKPRSRWRAGLLVLGTIVGGLALGTALGFLGESQPFEQRSIAQLVRDLRKADSPLDRLRQRLWPVLPDVITERLSHFSPMSAVVVRQFAAVELRRRAPEGAEAVPALVRALRDSHNGLRGIALQALAGFGPGAAKAVPEVLPMIELAGNPVLRSEAARTLIAIAPDDPKVRSRLLSILRDRPARGDAPSANSLKVNASQQALRTAVFRIVDKLARPEDDLIPLLLSELAQANVPDAIEIIGTLQRIGPVNREIIAALIQTLRVVDLRWPQHRDEVIGAVLRALQRLARTENDAVPSLIATLPKADPTTAARILQTLGFIGPLTPQVIPTVVAALHADNPRVQLGAIGALGTMGAKAAAAVPDLVRMLEAQRAAMTVTNVPSSPPVAGWVERGPDSAQQFGRSSPRLQVWAFNPDGGGDLVPQFGPPPVRANSLAEAMALRIMQSLAGIGPAARESAPALASLMLELKSELRYEAALALWQIERTSAAAKTVLIEGLNIPNPEVPRRLVRHFSNMGVDELPILNAALDHLDDEVRLAAFSTVSALASEAEPAVLALERIADDSSSPLRDRAARALETIQLRTAKGLNATSNSKKARTTQRQYE